MWARCSLLILVAACDRPAPLVICHNANCVEPVDYGADDTLPALQESLAIEHAGRPAIDGIEIDSFWIGDQATCVFAHDLNEERTTPFSDAALEVAAHFARPGPIGAGDRFAVFIELKSYVGTSKSERHTPEQRALHADCAWQAYAIIADAALANARDVEVVYGAFEPLLLRAVIDAAPAAPAIEFRLEAFSSLPWDLEQQSLTAYAGLPIEVVSLPARPIHDARYEGYLSSGLDIDMGVPGTEEGFAAVSEYKPRYIKTPEARLWRRWLSY